MSSPARRRELAAMREQEDRDMEVENRRKASLPLFLRIDELSVDDDVKAVLLLIAERASIDIYADATE